MSISFFFELTALSKAYLTLIKRKARPFRKRKMHPYRVHFVSGGRYRVRTCEPFERQSNALPTELTARILKHRLAIAPTKIY